MTRLSGVLISSLALYSIHFRSTSAAKDLKTFDFIQAFAWTSTGLLAALHRDNFKNVGVDLAVQFGLAGAFLFQGLTRK